MSSQKKDFQTLGWKVQLGGKTRMCGSFISSSCNVEATIAYHIGENVFIIAALHGRPFLKMVKARVTGEATFQWMDAKYDRIENADPKCKTDSTFYEGCFKGSSVSQEEYNVRIDAVSGSGIKAPI